MRAKLLPSPQEQNSLNLEVVHQIRAKLDICEMNDAVTGVVLLGCKDAFCGGADLSALEADPASAPALFEACRDLYRAVARFRKPMFSIAEGDINGAGLGLLTSAGYSTVTPMASLAFHETRFGFVADGPALKVLADAVEQPMARYLALSGHTVCGSTVHRLGMVRASIPHTGVRFTLHRVKDLSHDAKDDPSLLTDFFDLTSQDPLTLGPVDLRSPDGRALLSTFGEEGSPDKEFDYAEDEKCELETRGELDPVQEAWVEECFSSSSLEEIFGRVTATRQDNAWAAEAFTNMSTARALPLAATLALVNTAHDISMDEHMDRACRAASRLAQGPSFAAAVDMYTHGITLPPTTEREAGAVTANELQQLFAD